MFKNHSVRSLFHRSNAALLLLALSARTVTAEDEIVEIDPDNTLLGRFIDLLHDLWAIVNGFFS